MKNLEVMYKDFLNYKIRSPKSYINFIKKIHNFEDFKYALGLMKIGFKIFTTKKITNETLRGR